MSDYDDDSVTNNLRDSANGTFVTLDDFSPLTDQKASVQTDVESNMFEIKKRNQTG